MVPVTMQVADFIDPEYFGHWKEWEERLWQISSIEWIFLLQQPLGNSKCPYDSVWSTVAKPGEIQIQALERELQNTQHQKPVNLFKGSWKGGVCVKTEERDREETEDRVRRTSPKFISYDPYVPQAKSRGQKTSYPWYKEQMSVITSLILKVSSHHTLNQTLHYLSEDQDI